MLTASTTHADSYDEAKQSALKAFVLQSGLQTNIDQASRYLEFKSRIYANKIGIAPYLGTTAYLYKVYRNRSLSFPYKNQRITLGINDIYTIQWSWNY